MFLIKNIVKEQIENILKFLLEESYESFCSINKLQLLKKLNLNYEEFKTMQSYILNNKEHSNSFLFLGKNKHSQEISISNNFLLWL